MKTHDQLGKMNTRILACKAMRLKSSKVCTKKNLCVNKSSFQIFHSATLQDFFDGPMYVITSKE